MQQDNNSDNIKTDFSQPQNDLNNNPSPTTPTAPFAAPYAQQGTKRIHRVGTFTMGICLIALGLFLIIALFSGNFLHNFVWIARLAPLILISIGIEILVFCFRRNEYAIKYDALSVVVCILLMGASVITSFASFIPTYISARNDQEKLNSLVYTEVYTALNGNNDIAHITANIESTDYFTDTPQTTKDILPSQHPTVSIAVNITGPDKAAFAKTCFDICSKLKNLPYYNYCSFYFYSVGSELYDEYTLDLIFEPNFQGDATAESLIPLIHSTLDEQPLQDTDENAQEAVEPQPIQPEA